MIFRGHCLCFPTWVSNCSPSVTGCVDLPGWPAVCHRSQVVLIYLGDQFITSLLHWLFFLPGWPVAHHRSSCWVDQPVWQVVDLLSGHGFSWPTCVTGCWPPAVIWLSWPTPLRWVGTVCAVLAPPSFLAPALVRNKASCRSPSALLKPCSEGK